MEHTNESLAMLFDLMVLELGADVFERYERNRKILGLTPDAPSRLLNSGRHLDFLKSKKTHPLMYEFVWSRSTEGFNYWDKVYTKLMGKVRNELLKNH